jgi:hypothetical protein
MFHSSHGSILIERQNFAFGAIVENLGLVDGSAWRMKFKMLINSYKMTNEGHHFYHPFGDTSREGIFSRRYCHLFEPLPEMLVHSL